ncbi:17302_t:CDS:2 [Funneliformis geosporum]|uniref:17302_t:CDS:1 n=1 Tax=Funneliformis geosporum TaxID=1117311 RepID=A0A9W4SF15_9GLOM|nr:17302_t:CDS:2 [Funneliformis geosporum]
MKKNGMIIFNKPNITPIVFEMILKYLYTGELNLNKQLGKNIFDLLIASDELLLEELFYHVRDYLVEKKSNWVKQEVRQNFVLILNAVFRLPGCNRLQDCCLEFICANPQLIITSKNFSLLDGDIIFVLLKRDDLQAKEIVIWDCLIEWGIRKIEGLCNDISRWSQENVEELRKTLKQFIPLIRFMEISPDDFYDKVRPYKAIIPNQIFDEIEKLSYSRLSRDLSLRLNQDDDFNVIIQISEDQNAKSFRAHSTILRARSSYFKCVLSVTKMNDLITHYKLSFTPAVFNIILTYIYAGELYMIKTSGDDTFGLLVAADDLLLDELFIHNTPGLRSNHGDVSRWSKGNFEALKKTLNQFIPLVGFVEISPGDFFDYVRPYKAIIPCDTYEELAKFYYKKTFPKSIISPPRLRRIQSKIINPELTYIIARWIERNNESHLLLRKKYKFELLYRGTRDDIFRTKYSNHGPCLVLFKQHKSPVIYGEYNPLKFVPGNRWYSEKNSFIFSFENDQDTTNMRISRLLEDHNYTRNVLKRCDSYARNEWHNNKFYFASTFRKIGHFVYPNNFGYYDHKIKNDARFIPEERLYYKPPLENGKYEGF